MTIETITIKQAKISDALLISDLAVRSKSFWGYSDKFMMACSSELRVSKGQLQDNRFCYMTANKGNVIIGFSGLHPIGDNITELCALYVDPDYMGMGVGGKLLQRACIQARKMNAKKLTIQSDPNASKFYQSFGAKKIGSRESQSITGRFLPLFQIDL